jgi:ribosomal protein S18 acetylase RimI-like enzyme
VRLAELTARGRLELDDLNDRSRRAAVDLLDPLSPEKRSELLEAMILIRRHLRLSAIEVATIDPDAPEAHVCLKAYVAELSVRFPEGYSERDLLPASDARGAAGVFVVARENGHGVGCGVLRTPPGIAEIRHLWIDPAARGIGLGRRLVVELERHAITRGYRTIRLDTHRVLSEAINLYRSSGYQAVPAYDDNPHASSVMNHRPSRRQKGGPRQQAYPLCTHHSERASESRPVPAGLTRPPESGPPRMWTARDLDRRRAPSAA